TISKNQYDWAKRRIQEEQLDDKITLLFEDYRKLQGKYDKLVSIEMIEAVGHRYYDTFFKKCSDLLKPEGMMLIQAITIADQRYEQAKNSVDFIQRYIFPGSCIPSNTALLNSTTQASDLRLFHMEDIGPHYATTLRLWKEKLFQNRDKIRQQGYPDSLIRMWDFYLCYCEGGFFERAISDVHYIFTRPLNRHKPVLPDIRL
ncbi:class I SAM-dependent methyltransferase, partial [Kaarinaea lacus]